VLDDLIEFIDEDSDFRVMVEDDGRVAYAYLLNPDKKIIALVWLYNRCETPQEPEWRDREKMPFANPADYVRRDIKLALDFTISDFRVEWGFSKQDEIKAFLYLNHTLLAILIPGAYPGWSLLAGKDGPVAKVLPT
jgi:hypothetical protein